MCWPDGSFQRNYFVGLLFFCPRLWRRRSNGSSKADGGESRGILCYACLPGCVRLAYTMFLGENMLGVCQWLCLWTSSNLVILSCNVMHFLPKDHDVEPVDWPWPWHILFWMLCFGWSFPSFLPRHFLVSWLFIEKTYNVYQFIIVYPFLSISWIASNIFKPRFPDVSCIFGSLPSPQNVSARSDIRSQVPRRAGMKFKVAKRGFEIGWRNDVAGWSQNYLRSTWIDRHIKSLSLNMSCSSTVKHRLILYTWWIGSEDHYWTDDTKPQNKAPKVSQLDPARWISSIAVLDLMAPSVKRSGTTPFFSGVDPSGWSLVIGSYWLGSA